MKAPSKPFPLRLPVSVHEQAVHNAERDGISLNQFITLAIAEKLTRIRSQETKEAKD